MFYLWKFLAPYNLSFAYPYNGVIRVSSPEFFLPLIALLVLIIFVFLLRKKYPIIFFGSAFYLLTLVPTFTNFLKGGDVYIASDRYAYVPMIGLLLVIGSVLQLWLEKTTTVREQRMRALFAGGCFVVLTCVFMIASHAQATTWKDSAALNTHAIDVYHDTRPALHNLGMDYLEKGDPEKALELLNASLTVKDDMRTRVSKGAAFVALGRLDDARREFEGVRLKDPQNPDAYYGIGNLEYRLGRRESAIVYFKKTLVVRPDYANALNNLGGLYIEMQQWDNAIDVLQTSIAHRPDFAESYYNLGGAYEAKKMLPEAMKSYEKAIVLQPKNADALARLAKLEYAGGDIDKAAGLLQRALDLDGGNETAYSLLMMMRKDGVAD
jgi:tetratricopeptide (TPR) repeat protein